MHTLKLSSLAVEETVEATEVTTDGDRAGGKTTAKEARQDQP